MDSSSTELEFIQNLLEKMGEKNPVKEKDMGKRGRIGSVLKERQFQRTVIFWFYLILTLLSVYFLGLLIAIQVWVRIVKDNYSLSILSGFELETLSVAVFGQIIGGIHIISKRLWDDSPYIEKMDDSEK